MCNLLRMGTHNGITENHLLSTPVPIVTSSESPLSLHYSFKSRICGAKKWPSHCLIWEQIKFQLEWACGKVPQQPLYPLHDVVLYDGVVSSLFFLVSLCLRLVRTTV